MSSVRDSAYLKLSTVRDRAESKLSNVRDSAKSKSQGQDRVTVQKGAEYSKIVTCIFHGFSFYMDRCLFLKAYLNISMFN